MGRGPGQGHKLGRALSQHGVQLGLGDEPVRHGHVLQGVQLPTLGVSASVGESKKDWGRCQQKGTTGRTWEVCSFVVVPHPCASRSSAHCGTVQTQALLPESGLLPIM